MTSLRTSATLMSRRGALALGAGLSVAFLASGEAFGADVADRKLVVIVCRGAMDGLSVAPPIGDPDYAALRGPIAITPDQALKLDGAFGLHPKLATLHGLVLSGQGRIAPAVAIPERIRSHFEAQDLLETGGGQLYATTTGWLNRTLQSVRRTRRIQALSIGASSPLILHGPVEAESWSPGGRLNATGDQIAGVLQDLYRHDALLGPALASGLAIEAQADALTGGPGPGSQAPGLQGVAGQVPGGQALGGQPLGGQAPVGATPVVAGKGVRAADARAFAQTAAKFMVQPDGPSIAVLSLDGFDTHANQGAAEGQLANRLGVLDGVIAGLQSGLGDQWRKTVVVAATEFGRTARVNGTLGTDHGTASTLILAGGALKPGGIVGDWPTLTRPALFEDRDLKPTLDIRQVFKGVLIEHLGVDRRALDEIVFPASATAPPVRGLIA